VFTEIISFATT